MTDDHTAADIVPDSHRDLLEQPLIAHLATVRPDGAPQSNPVWFDWDGEHLKISQTKDRQKMHNIDHDPHVALSVTDPENPYRYLEVRGEVDRVEDDTRCAFIDELSERYMGKRPYPNHQPGDERVVVFIRPVDASSMAA
jgi:PPOX class probable F420-dependent enzyme